MISIKNTFLKKSPVTQNEVYQKYKYYKNLFSMLMEKIKQNYYERFLKNNFKNLKNIWQYNICAATT